MRAGGKVCQNSFPCPSYETDRRMAQVRQQLCVLMRTFSTTLLQQTFLDIDVSCCILSLVKGIIVLPVTLLQTTTMVTYLQKCNRYIIFIANIVIFCTTTIITIIILLSSLPLSYDGYCHEVRGDDPADGYHHLSAEFDDVFVSLYSDEL